MYKKIAKVLFFIFFVWLGATHEPGLCNQAELITTMILLGLGFLSMGAGAYGSVAQIQARQKMARYNAEMARRQAKVAEQKADIARVQAAMERSEADIRQERKKREMEALIGRQRVAGAKAGIYGGSLLELELDTAAEYLYDLDLMKYQEEMKFLGKQFDAEQYIEEAGLFRLKSEMALTEGRSAAKIGYAGMSSSLLSQGSSLLKTWKDR